MKKKSNDIFKKGKWCPLFGQLSRFEDEAPNSIKNRLIDIIYDGRELWDIGEPDFYQQLCPRESKLKWSWGISPQEIRDARLIYMTFMAGSMYATSADLNPSKTDLSYIESRAAGIAGVKSKFKGIRLYALLAICNAASALVWILYRHEDERNRFILGYLLEAQALMARADDIILNDERMSAVNMQDRRAEEAPSIDLGNRYSETQSKKQQKRHKKQEPILKERNKFLNRIAMQFKTRHPSWSKSNIVNHVIKKAKKNPHEWGPIPEFSGMYKLLDI